MWFPWAVELAVVAVVGVRVVVAVGPVVVAVRPVVAVVGACPACPVVVAVYRSSFCHLETQLKQMD